MSIHRYGDDSPESSTARRSSRRSGSARRLQCSHSVRAPVGANAVPHSLISSAHEPDISDSRSSRCAHSARVRSRSQRIPLAYPVTRCSRAGMRGSPPHSPGTTIAMFPLDRQLARRRQDPAAQENRILRNAAVAVEQITSPGAYFIGGGLYATGRLGGNRCMADLGSHGTEAIVVATGGFILLKGVFGRARPETVGAEDPQGSLSPLPSEQPARQVAPRFRDASAHSIG